MAQGSQPKKMKLSPVTPEMAQLAKSFHKAVDAGGELDNLKRMFNSYDDDQGSIIKEKWFSTLSNHISSFDAM